VNWKARRSAAPYVLLGGITVLWLGVAVARGDQACVTEHQGENVTMTRCPTTTPLPCDTQPHTGVSQTTGDVNISLVMCGDPTADQLRRQLRLERARHNATKRVLRASRIELRAANRRHQGTVDHAIHLAAQAYGVDHRAMRRVAMCESTMRPWARNGQYVGLFQAGVPFWRSTPFSAFDRTDPYANALATAHVVSKQGWRQWECKP
jgi:hypothetical protein